MIYKNRMSRRGLRRIPQKKSKYGNKKCEYRGRKFDSEKELKYYLFLLAEEEKGKISDLQCQVPFELQPSFKKDGKTIRAIKYIADFTYRDKSDILHIVDTKGYRTEVYKLKKKMMQYRGYDIEEV